jgi:hypothetical protein
MRRPGEPGFEIHEVQSSQAYVGFKPQRAPQDQWELTPQPRSPDGSRHYVLKALARERYVLLSPKEYFLWERFNGQYSLSEIGRAFHFEFGSFDYDTIRRFMGTLYHAGLLAEDRSANLTPSRARPYERRWARLTTFVIRIWGRIALRLTDADRYCAAVYNYGGFLIFQPLAALLFALFTLFAMIAAFRLWPEAPAIAARLTAWPLLSTGIMFIALVSAAMFHVCVHALACKAHGRKVREMGFFLLHGVWPTFYADVTDIFMSSRRARVMVDVAGPLVEVVWGSAAFIGAYASDPGIGQSLLFGAGLVLWESAVP